MRRSLARRRPDRRSEVVEQVAKIFRSMLLRACLGHPHDGEGLFMGLYH
jgi:hypothetical protein